MPVSADSSEPISFGKKRARGLAHRTALINQALKSRTMLRTEN